MSDLETRRADGDPLLDLGAVADMNEILLVRYENTRRAQRKSEQNARQGRRGR